MKAFIVVKKNQELVNGEVDFFETLKCPVMYPSLNHIQSIAEDEMVAEFEFVKPEELIFAAYSSYMDNVIHHYHVRWIQTHHKVLAWQARPLPMKFNLLTEIEQMIERAK